ncbi:MAG: 3-hydroxybutyryl-CoA dehydrogenase [Ignavibacteriales bacterium]|nr:3-hydroxybutyryl-CoA dehydrogenase [Ignavibacteriales bacterium]
MKTIGVIGAGTMGAGIAQVAVQKGFEVVLHDVSNDVLKSSLQRITSDLKQGVKKGIFTARDAKKALARLKTTTLLKNLRTCNLVIEAVVENLGLKKKLFTQLEKVCSSNTIFATNTSSLSVTAIASATKHPERVVGLHFFNPVPRMKLVEVISGVHTHQQTMTLALDFIKQLEKVSILAKDSPGFIVNRVARPFYGEALRLLGEGVASVAEIDRILKLEGGFNMGPFELMDLIGIDVNLAVTQSVYEQTFHEPRYRPHIIQQRMVEAGTLGRKTKKGFYSYK